MPDPTEIFSNRASRELEEGYGWGCIFLLGLPVVEAANFVAIVSSNAKPESWLGLMGGVTVLEVAALFGLLELDRRYGDHPTIPAASDDY